MISFRLFVRIRFPALNQFIITPSILFEFFSLLTVFVGILSFIFDRSFSIGCFSAICVVHLDPLSQIAKLLTSISFSTERHADRSDSPFFQSSKVIRALENERRFAFKREHSLSFSTVVPLNYPVRTVAISSSNRCHTANTANSATNPARSIQTDHAANVANAAIRSSPVIQSNRSAAKAANHLVLV